MRKIYTFVLSAIFTCHFISGQVTAEQFKSFIRNNQNLEMDDMAAMHGLKNSYYYASPDSDLTFNALYLDTIEKKLQLTSYEKDLLRKNSFVVTERLSYNKFEYAFIKVYDSDLPVFFSTDAVLQALHQSYDKILKELEGEFLNGNLKSALYKLYNNFSELSKIYTNTQLSESLKDVDLYVTLAYSLITDTLQSPHIASTEKVKQIWDYVMAEEYQQIDLFCSFSRKIDFSQFKPRGHYVDDYYSMYKNLKISLKPYFRAMMWLGRIDFLLSNTPDQKLNKTDLLRMNSAAFMLNQLLDISDSRKLLDQNNLIIDLLVGQSDNLTPDEYSKICKDSGIDSASYLLDNTKFSNYYTKLLGDPGVGQKILSDIFFMNDTSCVPDTLPISFKLMGQRFIIDSYIFSGVVYDRIIYNGEKIWRPLPDPLDAMFALGNNCALPLLTYELDSFHYHSQLASLRYLVDSYDSVFWNSSLYNCWLEAIRKLNTGENFDAAPQFMRTVAWQHEKLNTQLGSWTQLRHDNLLYAKPSYTGGTTCSYPHGYVEPYPQFYEQIANFASRAANLFNSHIKAFYPNINGVTSYFSNLKSVSMQLKTISEKELNREAFTLDEKNFLKQIIRKSNTCGVIYDGWYPGMFYNLDEDSENDYLVVDLHTQPTDQFGNVVGNVLHTGTGKVNLGIFLAPSGSNSNKLTAFVGPVMSYYDTVTSDFNRITDQDWKTTVDESKLPVRPDWVFIYLANNKGENYGEGRNLNKLAHASAIDYYNTSGEIKVYPNPSRGLINISFSETFQKGSRLKIYDYSGRLLISKKLPFVHQGETIMVNLNANKEGIYFLQLESGEKVFRGKFLLVK